MFRHPRELESLVRDHNARLVALRAATKAVATHPRRQPFAPLLRQRLGLELIRLGRALAGPDAPRPGGAPASRSATSARPAL